MRRTIAAAEVVGTAAIVAVSSTVTVAAPAIVVVAVSALVEEGIISTTRALTMFTAVRQAEDVPTKFVIQGIAEQCGLWCTAIQVGSIIPGQAEDCTTEPGEPSLLASNWADSAAEG